MNTSDVIAITNGVELLREAAGELRKNYQFATLEGANNLRRIARLCDSIQREAQAAERAIRRELEPARATAGLAPDA